MFEENVDDSFVKVADFEKDEEVDIPIVVKRIKMPTGRIDLLLVRKFRAM